MRAPRFFGRLQLLEDHDARAFADDEAVAVPVEGPRGVLRLVVARREGPHRREPADGERRDHRLRAARDHGVRVAVLDHAVRLADRVRARRAGGDVARFGPFAPYLIEILPPASFTMSPGMKNGRDHPSGAAAPTTSVMRFRSAGGRRFPSR